MIRGWDVHLYWRRVERALALHLRGEARNDGLRLSRMRAHLEVEWRARDIHPWDRAVPAEERAALFVKQTFADTNAALSRLFGTLPHVDSVELRVLDAKSEEAIMGGLVNRSSLSMPRPLSDRIWLGQLGIGFRLTGNRFEPLPMTRSEISRTA